jgi:hypothetical protein
MSRWYLVDGRAPLEEDQEHPRIVVSSEEQLRQELRRLGGLKPAMIGLLSPDGDHLDLALGGPYAGMWWWPSEPGGKHAGSRIAISRTPSSPTTLEFIAEGEATPFEPEELFPVEDVIEAAAFFFREQRLPEWLTWRQWNPATKQWDTIPSSGPAPAGALAK